MAKFAKPLVASKYPRQRKPYLSDGLYNTVIQSEEVRASNSGNQMLIMTFENAGGIASKNFNLWHPNPGAVQVALQELAELTQACGLSEITDTKELMGHEVIIKVETEDINSLTPNGKPIKKTIANVVSFHSINSKEADDRTPATEADTIDSVEIDIPF